MKEMDAVIFQDIGKWGFEKRPVPEVRNPGDVLVEVEACSICGTDVHVLSDPPGFAGTKGIILGHECVGTVLETGSAVKGLAPGDRVVLIPNIYCGHCEYCRIGWPNLCMNEEIMGVTIDGIFARYFVAPHSALTKIPRDMPRDLAVFCEPVNCVMGAMDQVRALPGDNALILGGGPIGLYYAMLLKSNGAGKVIVSEPSGLRAGYALDCGADAVINPMTEDLHARVMELTGGLGADICVDAVGTLIGDAIANTRRGGRIVLIGLNEHARQEICETDIMKNGLTVIGNYNGRFSMTPTVKMLSSGVIPVEKMITHRLPLSRFGEGLEAMRSGEALEVILYPD